MITVYFESGRHAEVRATFETEEAYMNALPELETQAEAEEMYITESIE